MKLAIIGSRNCPPIDIEKHIKEMPDTIISGGAKGADTLARQFANEHNLELIEFIPDYKKYGKNAPLVRNKLIVEACDSLLAFWDGKSKGTKATLDYAEKLGKPVTVVIVKLK